ncbi:MAG: uracil-DNA glycosylase, partial [Flavobacteriales bacterium]|nr:uracil-DNA glycosylase [Flavobacteriales bacterium]
NYKIFPPEKEIFNAFNLTPLEKIKVIIIGQDPYHGIGQAHGLCFSVNDGIKFPPSLKNIFKELQNDLDIPIPISGNLTHWAKQGVFLLNNTLTVREKTPTSHQKKGWEEFTDAVIKLISEQKSGVVFLLWGSFAQSKENLIDATKHHILKAAHPSPFSAHKGFLGCKHFSTTNKILIEQGKTPINF